MAYEQYPFFSDDDLRTLRKEFKVGDLRGGVPAEHLIGEILVSIAQTGKLPVERKPRVRWTKSDHEKHDLQMRDVPWLARNGFIYELGLLGPYSITPRGLLLLAAQHDSLRHMGRGGYDYWVLEIPRDLQRETRGAVSEWKGGNREGFAANPGREQNPAPTASSASLVSRLKF